MEAMAETKSKLALLGDGVKEAVSHLDREDIHELMKKHLQTLKLIDTQGEWVSESMAELSESLLPSQFEKADWEDFIDQILSSCGKNSYLGEFLETVKNVEFPFLRNKYDKEGDRVFSDVLAYALVLENLTKACASDWRIMEEVYHLFDKKRKELGSFKELPLFHKIKLMSVTAPIRSYIENHKSGTVSPTSGGTAVAINIMEAVWTDFKSGNRGNAAAGRILAKNKAGSKKYDEKTGAGPSGFSEDGKDIERVYPFPADWAGLYQAWNMCFVTRFPDFPYVMAKLLIPQVSNYHEKPKSYIYNRAIALFIYLNFASFDYVEKKHKGEEVIDWHDRSLSLAFGEVNRKTARLYQEKVDAAKKS
ncbi:MAG: hypothetical protein PQJ59_17350 [Spirochaetales bacterium]|nr:hypothetical protein [Spirochaetales bacterium]